jgi:hypothetical protein
MNKKSLGLVLAGALFLSILGGCSGGANKSVLQPQNDAAKPEMYAVGNGKVGLFHNQLSIDEAKQLITGPYGGRFKEGQEPAGEGTIAHVINAYFNGDPDAQPAIKITLNVDGKIYRIEALSPVFKIAKGLHVGSSWADIRAAYPQAKVIVENIIVFMASDNVACRLSTHTKPNWKKIKSGQENPPDDLKIVSMFTY